MLNATKCFGFENSRNRAHALNSIKDWKILEYTGTYISLFSIYQNASYKVIDIDPKKVEGYIESAAISYDFSKVVYSNSSSLIYLINADGSEKQVLLRPIATGDIDCLAWAPNGKEIAFVGKMEQKKEADFNKNEPTTWVPQRNSLYSYEVENKKVRLLVSEGVRQISDQCWSPDNSKIIYQDTKGDLYIYDLKSNRSELFVKKADYASWSPNGRWIAYAQGNIKEENYFIMSLDKLEKKLLIKKANLWQRIRLIRGVLGTLTWSPDSQYVYYCRDVGFALDAEIPKPFITNILTKKETSL
jgi:Tol biopolymer transport system component